MEKENLRLHRDQYVGRDMHIRVEQREADSFPMHSHEFFEIEIVLDGEGVQWLNGRELALRAGSVYFLTPADFHRVEAGEGMRIWNLSFDEAVLQSLLPAHHAVGFFRQVGADVLERLDTVCRLLAQEQQWEARVRPLMAYFMQIAAPATIKHLSDDPVQRGMRYVQTYFREDPTLADVAAQVCLSPVYFGNLFKKVTGETYVSYLNTCKVNCAVMLLENGVSVSQACFESGFGSLSGFLYAFKQKKGISPGEYQKKHQKGV